MVHATLITLHGTAGLVGLITGIFVARPPHTARERLGIRSTYVGALSPCWASWWP